MVALAALLLVLLALLGNVAAQYTVTTLADSGAGSLRQAIIAANSAPGTISFVCGHVNHALISL